MYADTESANLVTVESIILGLGSYSFPVNSLPKQNCAIRRGMRKSRGLKVRRYADRLIDLNEYLTSFPGAKTYRKIVMIELNENLLNSMTHSWVKQARVQGFYCESITFTRDVNMFERMEISESIYEGVV